MNIDTSSSSTAVSSASTSTSNVQSNSKSSKSDSSFEKEMETASAKEEQTTEKTEADNTKNVKTEDKTTQSKENNNQDDDIVSAETLRGELNFTDFKYHNESQSILSRNIQSLLDTRDMISFNNSDFSNLTASIDYQTVSMDADDAMFFTDLVKNTDMSMQSIASQLQQMSEVNIQAAEKTAKVSSTMMNLLSESLKTNQPFRIDFDKDISVIIKVNKNGSIMANFIPGDKAVEEYLKNNIGFLRQRFDDENLAYSQLSYSKHKQQQEQQNRNNKEKDDE